MHEVALAQSIMDIVLDAARSHGAERIGLVRLVVGQMTCVAPDSLLFAFQALSRGTEAEGAKVDFELVALEVQCEECGLLGPVDDPPFIVCSGCHSSRVKIVKGREIKVKSIEVADA